MKSSNAQLSVVLPARDEQLAIRGTLEELVKTLEAEGLTFEVVVVDDASRDATASVVSDLQLPTVRLERSPAPHGYGLAVRAGIRAARGDAVAISMADGSDDPHDLVRFYRKLSEGYDCVFGSRFSGSSQVSGYPPAKWIANRIGNALVARYTGSPYDDFTNGFKLFRATVLEAIDPLASDGFELNLELPLKAVRSGATYAVLPNTWRGRDSGSSKFRIRLAWRYLQVLWRLRHPYRGHKAP